MRRKIPMILIITMIVLVLMNPKAVKQGMVDGINICLTNLIPSLFPLFFLIGYLAEYVPNIRLKLPRKLTETCGLNNGTATLYILSLISGYPVGAISIKNLTSKNAIDQKDAYRLMGFCNNAGPAFIFGLTITLFQAKWLPWLIWGIQIASSILVSITLPKEKHTTHITSKIHEKRTLTQVMLNCIRSVTMVCAWVVFFRSIIALVEVSLPEAITPTTRTVIKGFFELSNGCIALSTIPSDAFRFVLFNLFLSFGGICVWLQIISSAEALITSTFFFGKSLHMLFCSLISLLVQRLIFNQSITGYIFGLCLLICLSGIVITYYCLHSKKTVAKQRHMMYNARKTTRNEA